MKLRSYLAALILIGILPLVVFAAIVGYLLVQHHRSTVLRGVSERAVALMSAVDAQLASSLTTLEGLAVVHSVTSGDLQYFRRTATAVLQSQPDWVNINLALPDGQQVVNLQVPQGQPLPNIRGLDGSFDQLLQTGRPVISDLAVGPVLKQLSFAVRVPVRGPDGGIRYVLSAGVQLNSLDKLLAAQGLGPQWSGAIIDRNFRLVGRSADAERFRGELASTELRELMRAQRSGMYRGTTREGKEVYAHFHRSEATGWSVVLGFPADEVDAVSARSVAFLAVGLMLAILVALALAHAVARRITLPISALATAADAIGRGENAALPVEAKIEEIARFAGTLRTCLESLHEREERMRMALAAGRMGSWEWDVRTGEVRWSPELEAMHGLAPGTFPGTFEAYRKDVHPDDFARIEREIAGSLQPGRSEHHLEYRIVRPDGVTRWVEGRGKVFRDEAGTPIRLVGICTDITERKQVEEALHLADRAKDEFLAMLGHELRNPLAALINASQVLRMAKPDGAAAEEARRVVERQTAHMVRLIEDLLDVSRVTLGKVILEPETFDLRALALDVLSTWRVGGRLDRHEVVAEGAPVWVHADRSRVEQILSNLLGNAVKFTPAGGRICVRIEPDGDAALLVVSDSGRGIPAEDLPRLFHPFAQGAQTMQRAEGGLGLGLALVKRLAELHGGSVAAESSGSGQGAAFSVRLPAVARPLRVAQQAASEHARAPRSILIIEDNADTRSMLQQALVLKGHRVTAAPSGEAGLQAAVAQRPDVALIDIGLPGMDGYEVAKRLRTADDGAHIGLIAITGYGQPEDQRRAREAGFNLHLTKPVSPEALDQVIAALD